MEIYKIGPGPDRMAHMSVELVADAEVGDLNLASVRPQEVARLQVAVDDLLIVD
jgi:hypothetical protein